MDIPSSTHSFQTFRKQHIELFLLFPGHMSPHFFCDFFQSHGQLTKSLNSKKTHFYVILLSTEVIRSNMVLKLFERVFNYDQSQLSSFFSLAAMLKYVRGSKSILAVKDHRAPFMKMVCQLKMSVISKPFELRQRACAQMKALSMKFLQLIRFFKLSHCIYVL